MRFQRGVGSAGRGALISDPSVMPGSWRFLFFLLWYCLRRYKPGDLSLQVAISLITVLSRWDWNGCMGGLGIGGVSSLLASERLTKCDYLLFGRREGIGVGRPLAPPPLKRENSRVFDRNLLLRIVLSCNKSLNNHMVLIHFARLICPDFSVRRAEKKQHLYPI